MTHKKLFTSVVALLVAAIWLAGIPADAFAAAQRSPLVSDTTGTCSGPTVGKSVVKTKSDGSIKVKIKLNKGNANQSATVYWVCVQASNGCAFQSCGGGPIGTFTTNRKGEGKFTMILPGNPFPGHFVSLALQDGTGAYFDSVFPNVP